MMFNLLLMIAVLSGFPARGELPGNGLPPGEPASQPARSPEEQLWAEIRRLQTETPATQPHEAWFAALLRQRETLLERVRLYLTLYPGGAERLAAVRLELATLHELGALHGGVFEPLCARAEEYVRQYAADNPIVWEAAYWQIVCQGLKRAPGTQPARAQVRAAEAERLAAYRGYMRRYPRSRRVPGMAALLFEHALQSGNRAEMRGLVEKLEQEFPEHATTALVKAQWERVQAIGRPFWLAGEQPDGRRLDTRAFVGTPVLIVVWSADNAAARRRVREVEEFRRAHSEVRVVGVNLDASRAEMRSACAELGIQWPQFNDGLGWANRFAREWGVVRVPHVFVINRHGCLAGSRADQTWRPLAVDALAED